MSRDVLFLDPGVATGWARLTGAGEFSSGEADFYSAGTVVRDHCITESVLDPVPAVGWEAFNITPQTYMMKGSSAAIEMIGVIKWVTAEYFGECLPPSPRQAKNAVSDAMLKALGWYRPGHGGHANDAARHLVVWLMQNRLLTGEQKLKISGYLHEESDYLGPDGGPDMGVL